jgi:predicted transposase YbfD/YdcC
MSATDSARIIEHFRDIEDPRIERNKRHLILDIIIVTICAVVCGCETWEDIEMYGKEKQQWLSKFLKLPNGIPSHDTIRRLFIRLNPEKLQECFLSWVQSIRDMSQGEIIAIDGKTVRRSHDRYSGKGPLHMINAWAHNNRLVLGQMKTDEHSNEITAIPELLRLLQVKGCIVTLDAIGCQKEIANQIIEREADYVLAVKANQQSLHEEIKWFFDEIDVAKDQAEGLIDYHKNVDKDHGRIEIREYMCSSEIDWLKQFMKNWKGVRSIAMVQAKRIIGDTESEEQRYYLSSLPADAELLGKAIRSHWGIENSVHWVMDMVFREDESRMRKGHSPENFAILRRIALNLVKRDTTSKFSLKARRKAAGWNNDYLERLLFATGKSFEQSSK